MFVKGIEISIFGEMTYSANIAFSQDAMSAPVELKKIIQEVCYNFAKIYCKLLVLFFLILQEQT